MNNYSLFNSFTKENITLLKEDIEIDNVSSLKYCSLIMLLFTALVVAADVFTDFRPSSTISYYIGMLVSLLTLVFLYVFKIRHGLALKLLIAFCEFGILGAGLVNSYTSPEFLTVMYICSMMVIGMAFLDRPIRMAAVFIIADVFYFLFVNGHKYADTQVADTVDILMYTLAAIFIGLYIRSIKIQRLLGMYHERELSEINRQHAYIDSMTDLFNSRAYHERIDELDKEQPEFLGIIVADVNGLKETNDTYGHKSGDELLSTTAGLLKASFSKYGSVYRIGGDEFMVIIDKKSDINSLVDDFHANVKKHNESDGIHVSASLGVASSADYPGKKASELVSVSDFKMYEAKRIYHSTHDRRKIEG